MIIKFLSLPEAFYNQSTCPFCCVNLNFNADVVQEWSDRYQTNQTTLTFHLDGSLSLTADYESGNIIRWSQSRFLTPIYVVGTDFPLDYSKQATCLATNVFATSLYCCNCNKYSRKFQVYVVKDKIDQLILNSETLSIEKDNKTYEITNNFVRETTVFTTFNHLESASKVCNLPLIPFDLHNPLKTLERIQTLVLFS